MLHDIRAHLSTDETIQTNIEADVAPQLERTKKRNILALERYAPSIIEQLNAHGSGRYNLFVNANGQTNIVDLESGQALYGLNPKEDVLSQWQNALKFLPKLDCREALSSDLDIGEDCLVVLGIGLGKHLLPLLTHSACKHVIIYEPNPEYIKCSVYTCDWQKVLSYAEENGINLYFQINADGSNLIADIQELRSHFSIKQVGVFKHYNTTVFDAVVNAVSTTSWETLSQSGISWTKYEKQFESIPLWTYLETDCSWYLVDLQVERFKRNIDVFGRFFPDIAKQFDNYEPKQWLPVQSESGEINLKHICLGEFLLSDSPIDDGKKSYQTFYQYPNKDGLVLGYDGQKLKPYTHYQFVKQTERLIEDIENKQGALTDDVESLILFGLQAGYSLSELCSNHKIKNLFICEPEPDFFYASLFAIDWATILENADERDARIYINIGDRGENLFSDLIRQFYAIGPYILVNTFFYQGYYRDNLAAAIKQLREQLQTVIAMGECYDHARYGISHTVELLNRGAKFLNESGIRMLSPESRDVPIFVVGNGPSLDSSIEIIKQERDKVLVVSCGTALQPLLRSNIIPDFHAEIEQNRSTFDWISRIDEFERIKGVTLLSCNGIHPDTCDLFKDVLIAFKEGESSTVSNQLLLKQNTWSTLEFAFPTVTNFVLNLFSYIGFTQQYLLGVDLGFHSDEHHHSSQSGYYDETGKPLYDYKEKNNAVLQVPGNFSPFVYTKYEFKVAREVMEQSIAMKRFDCFNCSDGARIAGTIPLPLEQVLITSGPQQKLYCEQVLSNKVFQQVMPKAHFKTAFYEKYNIDKTQEDLTEYLSIIEQAGDNQASIREMLDHSKTFMYDSYSRGNSLLFYLLYGTSNYANALLSKLSSVDSTDLSEEHKVALSTALSAWKKTVRRIHSEYAAFPWAYDFVSSFRDSRERVYRNKKEFRAKVYLYCSRHNNEVAQNHLLKRWPEAEIVNESSDEPIDFMMCYVKPSEQYMLEKWLSDSLMSLNLKKGVVIACEDKAWFETLSPKYPGIAFRFVFSHPVSSEAWPYEEFINGERAFFFEQHALNNLVYMAWNFDRFDSLIPKVDFVESVKESYFTSDVVNALKDPNIKVEFPQFIALFDTSESYQSVDFSLNRGRPWKGEMDPDVLFRHKLNEQFLQHYYETKITIHS